MRVVVWWAACALTLLAATSALRITQEEGAPRASRKLSALSGPSAPSSQDKAEEIQSAPTFRPRASRRNDEISPQEFSRIRPRNRPTVVNSDTSRTKLEAYNERSDSRRSYSRTRNRTTDSEPTKEPISKENVIRNRNRFSSRKASVQSTAASVETSSPTIDESKIEVVSTTLDEIAKATLKENVAATQYTKRGPVSHTTEGITTRRGRTRINVRTNLKPLDLAISDTTNAITISSKDSTTARATPELRSSKKLRYKPRHSETDTNLTGEGLATINKVTKSSQNKDTTSQSEVLPSPADIQTTVRASMETNPSKTTTNRTTKVVRRPLARGKVNFKPSASLAKQKKSSDEISEDDNYPASFKALLQAKNGSTQASSPESENLSVKASQKIYSTFTSSAQATETASENSKTSRLRGKASTGVGSKKDEDKQDEPSNTTLQVDQQKPKHVSRYRGSFNPNRNRKASAFTSTTVADTSVSQTTERSTYKYNRKFKVSTTALPSTGVTFKQRKLESSSLVKKHAVRPSFFTRRKNSTSTARPLSNIENSSMENDASNIVIKKKTLPKTSYYSRIRNRNKTELASSTTEAIIVSSTEIGTNEKVKEAPVDMPLIFNLLNKPSDEENKLETSTELKEPEKQKEMFIIAVASKESQELHSENSLTNTEQEGDDKPLTNTLSSTSKYHAFFKEEMIEKDSIAKEQSSHVSTPPINNIQTRKFGRQRLRQKEEKAEEIVPSSVTQRSRNRTLRKFSDNYSKTTEPSTNGIQAESEKSKNRYSSKFRASNIEKPIYKATVPTVTPSTAWLKFFVTDHQLAKAVEEPHWFRREDLFLTTEQPRSFTTQPTTHESSIELVEGEEFQLGPDMNAISITLPRSTLSSADLKLSESIMKPSHIKNLEASQHSSSVTISIFDALAEILTSTPRIPRLSTTTEVTQNPSNTDTKQTFNGVSSSTTVNKVKSLENKDTITSTSNELNTYTKSVQTTHQATLSVNNRVLVEGSTTLSLNTEPRIATPVNTSPISTPTPTTPISARRPFAIKLLYSESPSDKLSTTTESINSSSTDNPSTVYNTVSDLLLTNNNLLSSELTSMLSNNIRSIIQNMDAETRSKLKVDMDKVLKSLIPRALDRLSASNDDAESVLNTTPYSLEEIEDTENVYIINDNNSETKIGTNLLQNVTDDKTVNNMTVGRSVGVIQMPILHVNIANDTQGMLLNTLPVSSNQTTQVENIFEQSTVSSTTSSIMSNLMMSSISTDTGKDIVNSNIKTTFSNSTDNNIPLPFFTNAKFEDTDSNNPSEIKTVTSLVENLPLKKSVISTSGIDHINPQDPTQVSSLELWVLSKKARVLKMIEDLIRQHNDELATAATLTDIIQENNIPLSNRLTEIINSMTTTTEANDFSNVGSTSSMNILSSPLPLSTLSESSATTNDDQKKVLPIESNVATNGARYTTGADVDIINRVGPTESSNITNTYGVESRRDLPYTTMLTTSLKSSVVEETSTQEMSTGSLDDKNVIITADQDSTETTTAAIATNGARFTTGADVDLNNRVGSPESSSMTNTYGTESPRDLPDTIMLTTTSKNTLDETDTQETSTDSLADKTVITSAAQDSTQEEENSTETTTAASQTISVETETTQINLETTTETSTQKIIDNATTTSANERKQNINVNNNKNITPPAIPKKDYVIFGILPNNTVVRKDPNDDVLETLTESSPYIIYGVLPNNTVIRKFPNGTRVPRIMQKIDVLPISPWSLRNPYSPIHNNPAIVRPQSNPIRVSTNTVISTDTFNNGTERLINDTVNNQQNKMIPTSTLNVSDSSSLGVTATDMSPAEKSTASHVLSLRTTTMLPSVDEILLNSISSAAKEDMVISSTTISTREPTILTLDIDPETQQIRTEKPSDGNGTAVFKFIPINEVTVSQLDSNVLKLASTKAPSTSSTTNAEVKAETAIVTEINTQTPQIETQQTLDDPTTTVQIMAATPLGTTTETVFTNPPPSKVESKFSVFTAPPSTTIVATTLPPTTTTMRQTTTEATTSFTTTQAPTTVPIPITNTQMTTVKSFPTTEEKQYEEDAKILQNILQATERSSKSLNIFSNSNQLPSESTTNSVTSTTRVGKTQFSDNEKLLQAILAAQTPSTLSIPNIGGNLRISQTQSTTQSTTSRSLEDDLKQFEEDTKLLKALLAATGQNPANFNIPSLNSLNLPNRPTSTIPPTTTSRLSTTQQTTTARILTTTPSIEDDIKQLSEDAKLLQTLLKATGQNVDTRNLPIISANSNVRIASNPLTTSIGSNPVTPLDIRPVYASRTTTAPPSIFTTTVTATTPVLTTLQTAPITTVRQDAEISTTTTPSKGRRRFPTTTTTIIDTSTTTARKAPVSRFTVTTEIPSTSTFSDEEDIQFLKNLKSVLSTGTNDEDPESALANRVIALAVERSLNEIQNGKQADIGRTGKNVLIPTTQRATTTTTTTTIPTPIATTESLPVSTVNDNTPSLEEDIKQFQEDTKLLQTLLKATGQDPSKFNIPTLPPHMNIQVSSNANKDLNLLPKMSSPSPFKKQHDYFTPKSTIMTRPTIPMTTTSTTARPFGARIVVKDDLKNVQDEAKLLQTLVKLQGARETTTQKAKLAITGQSTDEALQKLIQQTKPASMMSDATKAPVSISTEYGKSNDALLAALLKEQGFGPTTASSLDEQLRLAALLNQVVVTPKARRTTTTPPPPPQVQRRPILDGLAWLWQQWRETGPGPGGARPSRRPAASAGPSITAASSPQASRLNWFGSGPFVGNADDGRETNRVPLEPPRAVTAGQGPARGQLVSAAINVTRAFSQFLGAALQGAAKTVQSVIQAGQRATNDIYANGSG